MFPKTTTKVNLNTDPCINAEIHNKIHSNVEYYKGKSNEEIRVRIDELEHEWDTERVLETNFAVIVMICSIFGLFKKRWLILSGVASFYMIKHALQGWCPPLPVIRKLGVRTASEIFKEKTLLKKLLE